MVLRVKSENDYELLVKNLIAGGVAGMCSKMAVAPLDRIKILLQVQNKHYKHLGVFSGLKEVVQRERFYALYKGNFAQMIRMFPYAAIQFTAFEVYKKYLGNLHGSHTHINIFLAGSAAGITAAALTYPLDLIRARLAFQVTGEHIYSGIIHAGITIFKEEGGIPALFKGFWPTIFGLIPYAGLAFYSFEKVKYLCMKYAPNYSCQKYDRNTGGLVLTMPAKLLCGGIAGTIALSFSYPLDVTRRHMQLATTSTTSHEYSSSTLQTIKMIYKENGMMKGLYRGMSVNYLRVIPMTAVSFATYEIMRQVLHLDTGMKL